jgi:streptogramin lyase
MRSTFIAGSILSVIMLGACTSLTQGASGMASAFRNTVGLPVIEKVGEFGAFDLERVQLKDAGAAPLLAVAVIPATPGVSLMTVDGTELKRITPGSGTIDTVAQAANAQIKNPSAVVVSLRHWIVLSASTGMAYKIDRESGEVIATISNLNQPRGVVELSDGSLLISEAGAGTISRFAPGKDTVKTILAKDLKKPGAMAQSGNGLFVSEAGAGQVLKMDPLNGRYTALAQNIQDPQGITVSSTGRVLVFEGGTKNLLSIDQVNGDLAIRASNLPLVGSTDTPVYISAARDEITYLSSPNSNALYRLTRRAK